MEAKELHHCGQHSDRFRNSGEVPRLAVGQAFGFSSRRNRPAYPRPVSQDGSECLCVAGCSELVGFGSNMVLRECHIFRSPIRCIASLLHSGSQSFPIGWENPIDGFRGHVFVDPGNTTVVLSIKGTTLNGPTSKADKLNDNLMFSCCCARVDFTWIFRTVCDCYAKQSRCDNTCLSKSLVQDSLFYSIGVVCSSSFSLHLPGEVDFFSIGSHKQHHDPLPRL